MTTKDEALRMALEALEYWQARDEFSKQTSNAITAIREVLAQPEGCQCPACKIAPHASDCPVHNEPAWPNGPCDCGAQPYPDNFIDALKYDVAKRDSEAQQHIEHCLWARNGNQPCPHVQPERPAVQEGLLREIAALSANTLDDYKMIQRLTAERKPLTDEQIEDIWNRYCDELGEASINDALDIARAIEAAHGIKGDA